MVWREWGEMVVVKVWKVETEVRSNVLYEYRISTASEYLHDLHQLLFVTRAMDQIKQYSHNPTTRQQPHLPTIKHGPRPPRRPFGCLVA